MRKREKKQMLYPTGKVFDPQGQNATTEELIDQLVKILIEGFIGQKAELPGKEGGYYRQWLQSFRFQQMIKDLYSENRRD